MIKVNPALSVLLDQACPSIHYRLGKELLGHSPSLPEMAAQQSQILADPIVERVVRSQASDGWIGRNFHGSEGMEAGIRLLCEKGVEPDHPVLVKALQALEHETIRLELGIGAAGRILDDLGFGGSQAIRAALFAQAGCEDRLFVQDQVEQALQAFRAVTRVESIESISKSFRGRLVFRPAVRWPSIYHLRLLAWTQAWRTVQNLDMLVESLSRLVRLSPLPVINVRWNSQIIAPASFCMDEFDHDLDRLEGAGWMMWFHRMELLARLGIVPRLPELDRQVQFLADVLAEGNGLFLRKLNHAYFRKWGAYTGLMLEQDWRQPGRRVNDLTFRSLLILYYAACPCMRR
jgi:hypothetical protein